MSSSKITKKYSVPKKPVPAKKPVAAKPATHTYVVSDEYGDVVCIYEDCADVNEVLSEYEEEYDIRPATVFKVAQEWKVGAAKKYTLTEKKNA